MTELATLEDRLSESLDSDGYLLKYFISATSMAFASASASATALSENLRISSDYYKAIESHGKELQARRRKLSDLFIKQAAPCQFCGGELVFSNPPLKPFLTELHCLACKEGSHWRVSSEKARCGLSERHLMGPSVNMCSAKVTKLPLPWIALNRQIHLYFGISSRLPAYVARRWHQHPFACQSLCRFGSRRLPAAILQCRGITKDVGEHNG